MVGPRARSAHARRGADPDHARAGGGRLDGAREGAPNLRLGDPQHALRGTRVRHPWVQAVPRDADRPARLWRLQRQGGAHLRDAHHRRRRRAHRAHPHAPQRSDRHRAGVARGLRSRDRVCPGARPLPRWNGGDERPHGAALDGPRRHDALGGPRVGRAAHHARAARGS